MYVFMFACVSKTSTNTKTMSKGHPTIQSYSTTNSQRKVRNEILLVLSL